tara:strand:- start:767 stop:2095 length:1329 start_codon:yes stop_codon:yes gene_type:complete
MKLIFGGSGLVGSNFKDGIKLSSEDVDLLNYSDTLKCIQYHKPKLIVHSACKKLSSKLLYDNGADYFDENVRMTLNIFKASAEFGVKNLLVIASINAFLRKNNLVHSDAYNHNIKKVLSNQYFDQYGLKSKVVYLSNVFGPLYKNSCNGFIPFIIEKCHEAIKNNTDLNITGDKSYKRNFVYIKDVIDFITSDLDNETDVVISTENSYTLEHVTNIVTEIMGFTGKVNWSGNYDDIKDKDINLSNQRLVNLNKTKLYDALKETIEWRLQSKIKNFLKSIKSNIPDSDIRWKMSADDVDFFNEVVTKLKELDVTNLLDIACGAGNLVKMCRDSGIESYGIDPIINNDSNIYQGTFNDVIHNQQYLENTKIDCISITNTLHGRDHISEELQQLFNLFKRNAKYIIISHPFSFDYLLEGLTLKHEFKPSHGGGKKTVFHKLYKVN